MFVTFLQHPRPLAKVFSNTGSSSYPNVKNFTSHVEDIKSPQALYTSIIEHAAKKHCLYKGALTEQLVQASRAGKTDKAALNQLLVLDVDGLTLKNYPIGEYVTEKQLQEISKYVINELPEAFQNVTHTVQASASLGLKGDSISLHYFFILNEAISPARHKDLLQLLNFKVPMFEENLSLQSTGKALSYPLDICMSQNSRIVYIADPIFKDGIKDPVETRTLIVESEHSTLNPQPLFDLMTLAQMESAQDAKIKQIRRSEGLTAEVGRFTYIKSEYGSKKLISNPDRMRMDLAYINGDFAYFDINGRPNHAYYVKLKDPEIVWNFKDEPVFYFKEADPDAYYEFQQNHSTAESIQASNKVPLVFRDFITGNHYNGIYDKETLLISTIAAAGKGDLEDYVAQNGGRMPDVLPTYEYRFEPSCLTGVNIKEEWINKFEGSDWLRYEGEMADNVKPKYATGPELLKKQCPVIYKVLSHMMNYAEPEIRHFINWLCYVIKVRDKTQTSWIFTGEKGTGKGVFFDAVVRPILSEKYLFSALPKDVTSDFKGWANTTILAVVDEFSMDSVPTSERSKFIGWIKSNITDKYSVARVMRQDPTSQRNYLNFCFLSNQFDVMKIEIGDRRFNISERQEAKIETVFADMQDVVENLIPSELEAFVQFINSYQIDERLIRVVIDNEIKRTMCSTTETSIEEFARSLRLGRLSYFIENIIEIETENEFESATLDPAKQIVKTWIQRSTKDKPSAFVTELTSVYNAITGKPIKTAKMSALLQHYGVGIPRRLRFGGDNKKLGWSVPWKLSEDFKIEELLHDHFTPEDKKYLFPLEIAEDKTQ